MKWRRPTSFARTRVLLFEALPSTPATPVPFVLFRPVVGMAGKVMQTYYHWLHITLVFWWKVLTKHMPAFERGWSILALGRSSSD